MLLRTEHIFLSHYRWAKHNKRYSANKVFIGGGWVGKNLGTDHPFKQIGCLQTIPVAMHLLLSLQCCTCEMLTNTNLCSSSYVEGENLCGANSSFYYAQHSLSYR